MDTSEDIYKEALEIIAGYRPCVDPLLALLENEDIAKLALKKANEGNWPSKTNTVRIQDRVVDPVANYLDPVTYTPSHANGDIKHKDSDRGVIVGITDNFVRVLYCSNRKIASTKPEDLVWG